MKLSKEVKVGLAVFVAFCLSYLGLQFLKGKKLFSNYIHYYLNIKDISNISIATPIKIQGYKVGVVKERFLKFDQGSGSYNSILEISVEPEFQIPIGSTLQLKTNMLTGNELVVVLPKKRESFYNEGDTIVVKQNSKDIIDFVQKEMLPVASDILPEALASIQSINKLFTDKRIDSSLNILVNSLSLMNQALIPLKQCAKEMPQISSNLREFSSKLNTINMDELKQTLADINKLSSNLKEISASLNKSKGSLGLLINERDLYNRLDSLVRHADSILKDFKEEPKKYVNLSIF